MSTTPLTTRSATAWPWERLAAASGIMVAIFTAAAMTLHGLIPDNSSTPDEIVQYYVDHATRIIVAHVLFNLSIIFFFIFAAALWRTLRQAEGDPAWLSAMTLSGAIMFGILATLGNVVWGTAGNMARDYPAQLTTGIAVELFHFSVIFFLAWLGLNVMQLAVALLIYRTRVLPVWLAWLGLADFLLWMVTQWPIPRHATTLDNIVLDYSGPAAFAGAVIWVVALSIVLSFGPRRVRVTETPIAGA